MYGKKEKQHIQIIKKATYTMHKKVGRLYNYPECCVEQFAEESKLGIISGTYRERTHEVTLHDLQLTYVPCDSCIKNFIKTRNTPLLIKNKQNGK